MDDMVLVNNNYEPFLKPRKVSKYVSKTRNRPPSIITNILFMIQKQTSDVLFNETSSKILRDCGNQLVAATI